MEYHVCGGDGSMELTGKANPGNLYFAFRCGYLAKRRGSEAVAHVPDGVTTHPLCMRRSF